jgi:beta-phosphoglucomutase
MSDLRAVLWDLDGTLVDSADYHWRAWKATMGLEGVRLARSDFDATFGQRNDAILSRWLGPETTPDRVERIGAAKEATYRRLMREGGLVPLPGATTWLARLRRNRWKQAIASSAPRANVDAVVDVLGWEGRFDALAAAEDVTAGKPDPQVFLVAAGRLGVSPSRCVVVEDAVAGIEAARRAGMRSIGVGPAQWCEPDVAAPTLAALPGDAFERLVRPGGSA